MQEIWKDVLSLEGQYKVSNFGRVMSFRMRHPKILKCATRPEGYKVVKPKKGGNTQGVHNWVAKAFIPNPDNKPYVDHIDGDCGNNHISNLRWCTHKENCSFDLTRKNRSESRKKYLATKEGMMQNRQSQQRKLGKAVNMCTPDGVIASTFPAMAEASRQTGVGKRKISYYCKSGKILNGYIWKLVNKG